MTEAEAMQTGVKQADAKQKERTPAYARAGAGQSGTVPESTMTAERQLREEISQNLGQTHRRWMRIAVKKQAAAGLDQDTIMYGKILLLIYFRSREKDVYQKDVEKTMDLNKSTLSTILTNLEKKGYIRRESVSSDARLKKLVVTDRGSVMCGKLTKSLEEADNGYVNELSEEEQRTLLSLLKKVNANMKVMESELNGL